MSLYEQLGLSKGADTQEIRRAYLRLSKTAHPDKGGSAEQFKTIQQAYEILSDDQKRAYYDQTGQVPGEEGVQEQQMPFNMGEMFGGMFGGMFGAMPGMQMPFGPGRPQQNVKRPKGPPKVHEIGLKLNDYFYGKTIQIKFGREKFCVACKGVGAEKFESCNGCGGSGVRESRIMIGPGMQAISRGPCQSCAGQGKLPSKACSTCNGSKSQTQEKTLTATIKPGMSPGDILKFPNECSDHQDYEEPGDVHIILREAEETTSFSRIEADLSVTVKITLAECLLGCTRVLSGHPAHPNGLTVIVPAGSNSGDTVTVAGEGMPCVDKTQRGNLQLLVYLEIRKSEKDALVTNHEALKEIFTGKC